MCIHIPGGKFRVDAAALDRGVSSSSTGVSGRAWFWEQCSIALGVCGRECCSRAISSEQGYQACGVSAGATIRPCCSQGDPAGAPQASHAGSAEQGSTKGLTGCCAAKDPGLCMCQVSKGAAVAPHRQPGDNREAAGATDASVSYRSCIYCRVLELYCMSLPWHSSEPWICLR